MDFPTPEQELDRKTVAEFERLVHGMQARKVSIQEAGASLVTLWNVVSGLVPKDTMDILGNLTTGVRKRLDERGDADNVAVLMGAPGGAYVIRRDAGTVTIISWVGNLSNSKALRAPATETFPERWAAEQFDAAVQKINKQGFALIFRQ